MCRLAFGTFGKESSLCPYNRLNPVHFVVAPNSSATVNTAMLINSSPPVSTTLVVALPIITRFTVGDGENSVTCISRNTRSVRIALNVVYTSLPMKSIIKFLSTVAALIRNPTFGRSASRAILKLVTVINYVSIHTA